MGLPIDKHSFTKQDFKQYKSKLQQNLQDLEELLQQPGFGVGDTTVGGEIEYSIVDDRLQPNFINAQLLNSINNSQLQLELNKFNLEFNLKPVFVKGSPFSKLEEELKFAYDLINKHCANYNSKVVPIGILPTLRKEHFSEQVMTDLPRYKALSNGIKELRNGSFKININGCESLQMEFDELTLEGASTSFQFQLKVEPKEFAKVYNAVQLVTPLAIAISANSPVLLEKLLWDETRIALFKQSIESRRDENNTGWRQPNRVSFGYGWVRNGPYELFAEHVALFPPILPIVDKTNHKENGAGPPLLELRLHAGSIWNWNRVIYDPTDGGHIRIEMRTLPSGPSVKDMVANAGFLLGLAMGIKDDIPQILPSFPFMFAEYNFYRAAQSGLDANILWPNKTNDFPITTNISNVIKDMLPYAAKGLDLLEVDDKESAQLLKTIKHRLKTKQTGSNWQKTMVRKYEKNNSRRDAIELMLQDYISNIDSELPVHKWKT